MSHTESHTESSPNERIDRENRAIKIPDSGCLTAEDGRRFRIQEWRTESRYGSAPTVTLVAAVELPPERE